MPEPEEQYEALTPEQQVQVQKLMVRGAPLETALQMVLDSRPTEPTLWEKLGITPTIEQEEVFTLTARGVPFSIASTVVADLSSTFPYWSDKQKDDWLAAMTGYRDVTDKKGNITLQGTGLEPGWWAYQEQMSMQGVAQAAAANRAVQERISQLESGVVSEEFLRQRAEAERQGQIAERVGLLGGLAPTKAQVEAPFIEQARGVSPAFQEVAGQRFLRDIFAELGMEQKRKEWWEKGAQRIGEQLLPETQQEKELMALKRADPWAQLLSQPTFLQQLETRFRGLSPAEKGVTTGRFKPRTRFL